jgi:hypothetical protein
MVEYNFEHNRQVQKDRIVYIIQAHSISKRPEINMKKFSNNLMYFDEFQSYEITRLFFLFKDRKKRIGSKTIERSES